jgi:hypothetical protein
VIDAIRLVQLKQWKRGRTVFRELRARGISQHVAALAARFARNWWSVAGHKALQIALPTNYNDRWEFLGLPADLNRSNCRMRTRTSGGVGGE